MKKNELPTSAKDAYQATANDVASLVDVLQMEIDAHADKAAAEPRSWGWVTDLDKVRHDLIQIVSFLSGMTEQDVEDFLER